MSETSASVLVPLDGSRLAEHALAYVSGMRALGVTKVHLLSVVEPAAIALRGFSADEERERNLLASYLKGVADDIHRYTTLDVETHVASGIPAFAILNQAEVLRPDYLLISTHGASGLSRWRIGSVADKVIRGATCPALVIGPRAAEREEHLQASLLPVFKHILVPLDGSEIAEQALPVAQHFANAFGAQLHVVSVVSLGFLGLEAAWAGASPALPHALASDAEQYLQEVCSRSPGLERAQVAVRFGTPAEALTGYITDHAVDLVIMSSHGRGGFVRTALGSTTDRMLGGPAPVLIVRPQS